MPWWNHDNAPLQKPHSGKLNAEDSGSKDKPLELSDTEKSISVVEDKHLEPKPVGPTLAKAILVSYMPRALFNILWIVVAIKREKVAFGDPSRFSRLIYFESSAVVWMRWGIGASLSVRNIRGHESSFSSDSKFEAKAGLLQLHGVPACLNVRDIRRNEYSCGSDLKV